MHLLKAELQIITEKLSSESVYLILFTSPIWVAFLFIYYDFLSNMSLSIVAYRYRTNFNNITIRILRVLQVSTSRPLPSRQCREFLRFSKINHNTPFLQCTFTSTTSERVWSSGASSAVFPCTDLAFLIKSLKIVLATYQSRFWST